ncbi:MAG: MmgE/PrpD family protein [Rhodobacteraceae bacterium]|nr:MmgE/PrpD family protein [Paracoccaceae bacterium]
MTDPLAARLARFAALDARPAETAGAVAALSALDWLACGLAGADEPVATLVRDLAMSEGGTGEAHVFGATQALPARAAALVNGTASHALDYDDTHFAHIGHPSVAVFPAALAMAASRHADVAAMMQAALIGMELSVRVGLWLGRGHYQTGFHQTATAGAFGATAAAGRLIGLDAARMTHALALCATRAAGLKSQFGTMGKPYNAGLAAETGVQCARLAALGFVSNPEAMDGASGFGATHCGADHRDAFEGIGDDWLFETVSHKFHACCHGLHATLEAMADTGLAGPEVAEVIVHTHPRWLSVCHQPAPDTGLGAKFSYTTVVAMALLGVDTGRIESFSDALCTRQDLRALREKVQVVGDEDLSEMQARIRVLRRDGETVTAFHDLDAPRDLAARHDRVTQKAIRLIGPDRAARAADLIAGNGLAAELDAFIAG